jgi:hypothetical protein
MRCDICYLPPVTSSYFQRCGCVSSGSIPRKTSATWLNHCKSYCAFMMFSPPTLPSDAKSCGKYERIFSDHFDLVKSEAFNGNNFNT